MMNFLNFPTWLKPEIIPGFPLRWYGLMYVLAFGTAYFLFVYQIRRDKISMNQDDALNLFLWTILGLLIGARIFATLVYDTSGYYLRNPWLIFWPFRDGRFTGLQGMSYHGGVIGAVVGGFLYCRKHDLRFFHIADLVTAGIPLGYTFGRLGNFINGELWGRVTERPWGILFPAAPKFSVDIPWVADIIDRIALPVAGNALFVNLPRHPSQLYEALLEGVLLWLIIWFLVRPRKRFHGSVISVYLIGYGVARFLVEYFREPDRDLGFIIALGKESEPAALLLSVWNFTMGQLLSFLMIIAGIALFLILRHVSGNSMKQPVKRRDRNSKGKSTRR